MCTNCEYDEMIYAAIAFVRRKVEYNELKTNTKAIPKKLQTNSISKPHADLEKNVGAHSKLPN